MSLQTGSTVTDTSLPAGFEELEPLGLRLGAARSRRAVRRAPVEVDR